MRWRLRLLFLGLMAVGVCWIYLSNYVRQGRTLAEYSLTITLLNWGGALFIGLLLDGLAGFYLRPFFRALARLRSGMALAPQEGQAAALRAMRFPERASLLLLGVSAAMIPLHRAVLYRSDLMERLLSPERRAMLLSSMTRDMVLALLLALLLFTFSRRLLKQGVVAFGLREVPDPRRFPVGLRQALVVLVMGIFNATLFISAPEQIPTRRLIWIYLPPVTLTAMVAYLVASDTGRDLDAITGRLRMLAAGVRPDLFRRFAVTERDEVGDLVASINLMQNRVERELWEFERDMAAARSIQTGMLPHGWQLPPGWQLAARLHPAREVGGDFYDLIDLGEGRYGMVLGDAAGKGLPAALLMASTVSLIRSHAPLHQRPGEVLAAVNRLLCRSLPPMTFVTAVYVILDTVRNEIRVASAGHLPPMVGGQELPVIPALPLGIEPEVGYEEQVWPLAPGQPLLLYSDGLIEGAGIDSPLLDSRWTEALQEPCSDAEGLVRQLVEPLMDRARQSALQDDVTVLALIPPALLRFEVESEEGAELEAARRAAGFAREHGYPRRAEDVAGAVGEACLNAIAHGNRFRTGVPVRVTLSAGPDWLEATVADTGPLFAPPEGPPDLAAQMSGDGPIRGWGFHLIRSLSDAVQLESLPTGKQVRMRFRREADV
ncbi:MAG: SpoIIE family protein phosphatase [Bacillota bacterium]